MGGSRRTDRILVTAIAGVVTVALAIVVPPWLFAIPITCLSFATALAIIRRPQLALGGLRALTSLLTAPLPPANEPECELEVARHVEIDTRPHD